MSSAERKLFCELCVVEFSSLQILKAHDFEKHQLGMDSYISGYLVISVIFKKITIP